MDSILFSSLTSSFQSTYRVHILYHPPILHGSRDTSHILQRKYWGRSSAGDPRVDRFTSPPLHYYRIPWVQRRLIGMRTLRIGKDIRSKAMIGRQLCSLVKYAEKVSSNAYSTCQLVHASYLCQAWILQRTYHDICKHNLIQQLISLWRAFDDRSLRGCIPWFN